VRRPLLVAVPLLLALALTGCSGGADSESAAGSAGEAADTASGAEGAAPAAPPVGQAPDAAAPPDADTAAPLGRVTLAGAALIRTAQLAVRVEDMRPAADRAVDITVAAGGVVTSEQASGQEEHGQATLVLRVPPDRFDATLDQLAGLGEELSRTVGTEDVTDQVVDLESRLATQRASVERVRALLEQAENLGEVVQIEAELTRRTADLESLQARLAALTERVELSTITLELYSDESALAAQEDEVVGFMDGLRGGWAAFLATVRVLGATTGALLPFLPILLLGALAWRLRSRCAAGASSA
jgi:hypothetical protein